MKRRTLKKLGNTRWRKAMRRVQRYWAGHHTRWYAETLYEMFGEPAAQHKGAAR